MSLGKRIFRSPQGQAALAKVLASYLKLVWKTTRTIMDPPDAYAMAEAHMPAIFTMWHGQHFMMPFLKKPHHRAKVLVSLHADGEINARVAEQLDVGTIRGSGSHHRDFRRKGGVVAFGAMLEALRDGCNVAITADVPKVSRIAGLGVVKLAQHSGRPILPIGIATQHRHELKNWDRSAINLPFGRMVFAIGDAISVAKDANDDVLETLRQRVEDGVNQATARAYAIADGRERRE